MFTGIITDVGKVVAVDQRGDRRLRIACRFDPATIDLGASIACHGVCLTVVEKGGDAADGWFCVDISAETLARSNAGRWTVGTPLNLERSLKVGDELGGHIVTGHVDAIGEILSIEPEGDSRRILFRAPPAVAAALAAKGSIALDGVSLTVNTVEDQPDGAVIFGVNLIAHTLEWTGFGAAMPGDAVNIEIDILARYIARLDSVRRQNT